MTLIVEQTMEMSVPSQNLKGLVKIDSDFESCITITVTAMQGWGVPL